MNYSWYDFFKQTIQILNPPWLGLYPNTESYFQMCKISTTESMFIIYDWSFVPILEGTHEIQAWIWDLKAGHQYKILKWNRFHPQHRLKGTFPITRGRSTFTFLEDVFMIDWRQRKLLPWFLAALPEKKDTVCMFKVIILIFGVFLSNTWQHS